MKILAINPGGTSTKVAAFDNDIELFNSNVVHTPKDLAGFATVFDQFSCRKDAIIACLAKQGHDLASFACIVGRGGLLKNVPGGTYSINDAMIDDLRAARFGEHPSNLGPVLARELAKEHGVPSYIVDPVSVNEFWDIAKISGISDIERPSWLHALNHKAVCREMAKRLHGSVESFNFIVAHLGSGISIAAHYKGRMVDGSGGRSNGPFSPERSGGLPAYPLVQLCYSGRYTHKQMVDRISLNAGMFDYLGTKDMMEVEKRAAHGDAKAELILNAFIYQIAKEIALYSAALMGKIDRIILTGGISHSSVVTAGIKDRIGFLAPVEIMAGEKEMESLALGALRVLLKQEEAKEY